MLRYWVGVLLLCSSAAVVAEEIDLTLSDNGALFRYIQHSSNGYGDSQIDAGFVYTKDYDFMFMLGIQVEGEAGSGSPGLSVGIGVKAFGADAGTFDFLAVAIGGGLRYAPAAMERVAIRGTFYYASSIVTFLDIDRFTYASISLEYEILKQASVYLGHRYVNVNVKDQGSIDIDGDTHIGMRIVF